MPDRCCHRLKISLNFPIKYNHSQAVNRRAEFLVDPEIITVSCGLVLQFRETNVFWPRVNVLSFSLNPQIQIDPNNMFLYSVMFTTRCLQP